MLTRMILTARNLLTSLCHQCVYHLKDRSIRNYGLLLPHSPSVLYTFYHIHPVSYTLIISPLLNFLPKHLSSSPPSWVVDLVLIVGLVEWIFVVVLWFFLFCSLVCFLLLSLFLYPIHPVYLQLSFTPHLNFLIHPNLSVLVLVKVMRNSTYKVGWEEW